MATFITLTQQSSGRVVRVNTDLIASYLADGEMPRGSTVFLAGTHLFYDVTETPEQIDALIAQATAPMFTCRSCGSVGSVEDHAPDDSYGADLCGRCWSDRDNHAVAESERRWKAQHPYTR